MWIGRDRVGCQFCPQCRYSFFWITPVYPAVLYLCLYSWVGLERSRLNSVFNCPCKRWTNDPTVHFWQRRGVAQCADDVQFNIWARGELLKTLSALKLYMLSVHMGFKTMTFELWCDALCAGFINCHLMGIYYILVCFLVYKLPISNTTNVFFIFLYNFIWLMCTFFVHNFNTVTQWPLNNACTDINYNHCNITF